MCWRENCSSSLHLVFLLHNKSTYFYLESAKLFNSNNYFRVSTSHPKSSVGVLWVIVLYNHFPWFFLNILITLLLFMWINNFHSATRIIRRFSIIFYGNKFNFLFFKLKNNISICPAVTRNSRPKKNWGMRVFSASITTKSAGK
jgi:hypothetical protein